MSLRLRLVVFIGVALTVLWGASAAWMWRDVSHDVQRWLDARLAMSAHMVAGLLDRQLAFETGGSKKGIADKLVTVPANQGMACQIRSMHGEVIAATRSAPTSLTTDMTPGYGTRVIDGAAWRTFTLQTNGLSITTADRVSGRDMLRQQIALTVGIPFLIAVIGGLLVLWLGTARGLRPLRHLRQAVSRRGPDALDPIRTRHLPRELLPLVETLNQLLQRTQLAMQRERHFTNDAAHELRTPLTAVRTHLQVARMTLGRQASTALADAEAGALRMQSTLEQLLLLARVEGQLPFNDNDRIDASTVLNRAVADSGEVATARVIRQVEGGDVELAVAPQLAVIALRNLIENALQCTSGDTLVRVDIRYITNHVVFCVVDEGPGLSSKDAAQATQRFWRTGKQPGSGLGLTIVDAIARRYGGQLALSSLHPGLEACLTLPARKQE